MAGRKRAAYPLIALAALATGAAAGAALPKTTAAPAPAAAAAPDIAVALKQLGFSDPGIALIKQTRQTPDPQVQKLVQQREVASDRMRQIIVAPKFDGAAFAAAWDALFNAGTQLSQYGGAKDKALLQRLPEADKPIYAKVMLGLVRRAPAPGAAPAAPPKK